MPDELIARSAVFPFVHRQLGQRAKFFLAGKARVLKLAKYSRLMYPMRVRIQISFARLNLAHGRYIPREMRKALF